jgi:hypothetical protein
MPNDRYMQGFPRGSGKRLHRNLAHGHEGTWASSRADLVRIRILHFGLVSRVLGNVSQFGSKGFTAIAGIMI